VILAYSLAPVESIGVLAIWWAIPIGWFLADMTGILYMFLQKKKIFGDII
jgi:Na+-driven multidrug efflux pump